MLNQKIKQSTFHVQTMSRAQISARLHQLATDGAALYERAARGEQMTARDLAQAIEYNQRYVDLLAELEDTLPEIEQDGITAKIGGKGVKFTDIDGLAEWIAGVME